MNEAKIDKYSGLVLQAPCIADSKGLCKLRRLPDSQFDCAYKDSPGCRYKVIKEEKKNNGKVLHLPLPESR